MEIVCLGFLIGVVFSVVFLGGSVLYLDRKDKKQSRDQEKREYIDDFEKMEIEKEE